MTAIVAEPSRLCFSGFSGERPLPLEPLTSLVLCDFHFMISWAVNDFQEWRMLESPYPASGVTSAGLPNEIGRPLSIG
jgi:hypothetical protein